MVGLHPASATHHAAVANRCHEGAGQPTSQPTNLRSISPSAVPRSVETQPPSRARPSIPVSLAATRRRSLCSMGTQSWDRQTPGSIEPSQPSRPPQSAPSSHPRPTILLCTSRASCQIPLSMPKENTEGRDTHARTPSLVLKTKEKKNCTDIDDLHFQLHVIHPSHHSAPRSQAESSERRPPVRLGWLLVGQARNSAQKTHNP